MLFLKRKLKVVSKPKATDKASIPMRRKARSLFMRSPNKVKLKSKPKGPFAEFSEAVQEGLEELGYDK